MIINEHCPFSAEKQSYEYASQPFVHALAGVQMAFDPSHRVLWVPLWEFRGCQTLCAKLCELRPELLMCGDGQEDPRREGKDVWRESIF